MIGINFTETSNKVELQINRVRINRARPVIVKKNLKYHSKYGITTYSMPRG